MTARTQTLIEKQKQKIERTLCHLQSVDELYYYTSGLIMVVLGLVDSVGKSDENLTDEQRYAHFKHVVGPALAQYGFDIVPRETIGETH